MRPDRESGRVAVGKIAAACYKRATDTMGAGHHPAFTFAKSGHCALVAQPPRLEAASTVGLPYHARITVVDARRQSRPAYRARLSEVLYSPPDRVPLILGERKKSLVCKRRLTAERPRSRRRSSFQVPSMSRPSGMHWGGRCPRSRCTRVVSGVRVLRAVDGRSVRYCGRVIAPR